MNTLESPSPAIVAVQAAECESRPEELQRIAPLLTAEARQKIAAMIAVRKDGTPRLTWSRFQ